MPRAMDAAIVWERLERRELKRRERLMGGAARPGQRPVPSQPAGTDLLPQIEHIVVLMMENHSYDNYLPALTARDAAAASPLSALDLCGPPAFLHPPCLPEPGLRWGTW